MKDARQPEYFVAMPADMLPRMKPTGLPDPKAPVTRFRRRPSEYVANNVPIAGADIIAVPNPRMPQRTFMVMGLGAKEVPSEERLRSNMPARSCILRPKRSAVFPKKSMKEPLARLFYVSQKDFRTY